MRKKVTGTGVLFVIELGSEWPGFVDVGASARRVLSQREGEPPAAFAERVASGLDGAFAKGIRLALAVVACNERTDEVAQAARRKVSAAALGAMAKHQQGKLVLAAATRASAKLRRALSEVSQGADSEWRTAGLEAALELPQELRPAALPAPRSVTARVA